MHTNINQEAFFALVKAGLWPNDNVNLNGNHNLNFDGVDWEVVYRLAEEQSVVGLIAAGMDNLGDRLNVPLELKLQIIGEALQIEQTNKEMNAFVARLIEKLQKEDVYAVLVKGQGIAQCYEKPLWRSSGDVDLLLSDTNYEKAKKVLLPLAVEADTEFKSLKHLEIIMPGGFVVELHGMFHSRLSNSIDKVIDKVQREVCNLNDNLNANGCRHRVWRNGNTDVMLPAPDEDVIIIFTHILKHFYIEGVGLRQICDWCRLLYTYREKLDLRLLESRIQEAGLMTEWRSFASLAVQYLGMDANAVPFYSSKVQDVQRFKRKAERIMEFVMESGNFGHNREIKRSSIWIVGKLQAAWFKMRDFIRHARVFPMDSMKFFWYYAINGMLVAREQSSSGTD